jgi:ABC-type Fe3+/spermidine/putrescine transport system ATPase subunit
MIRARLIKHYPATSSSAGFSLDVDLQTGAGLAALFGPSGSGKTQVLELIAGFSRPDAGRILLDDEILFDAGSGVSLPPRRRNGSYLFRDGALFPHMTMRENLVFAVERRPRLERHRSVNETLERFRLTGVSGRRPHEVSAAEQERGALARAIIGEPRLLLLDDPWGGLDVSLRREMHALTREVRAEFKVPILLATADLEECFELADEMHILREGRIVQSGAPRIVLDQPASVEVARMLGRTNLFEAEIVALDPGRNTSRIRFQEQELHGAYFPGRLLGDRVWLCVRAEDIRVAPHNGSKPGLNQVPARLVRFSETPQSLRLEFSGGISTEVPRAALEGYTGQKDWLIEFPAEALRVL